VTMAIKLW